MLEFSAIGDYGVIGDCRSAALVSKRGSIDWLCWPRFDSASIFAALLDHEHGGGWSISPSCDRTVDRRYVPDTNVLVTRFGAATGTIVLTDLMPVRENTSLVADHEIIRQVECLSGEVEIEVEAGAARELRGSDAEPGRSRDARVAFLSWPWSLLVARQMLIWRSRRASAQNAHISTLRVLMRRRSQPRARLAQISTAPTSATRRILRPDMESALSSGDR